jgi:RNA 3'-terminal phosphate cyclase (ATP)
VGAHLADQLLLPMALGGGGEFLAAAATSHLRSNAAVIERFTGRRVAIDARDRAFLVTVR